MDSAAAFLSVSRAVSVLRQMEALDGAALLAGRRIPNHLRGVRKTMILADPLSPRSLRPLYSLHHRWAAALHCPSCGVASGKVGLGNAGPFSEQRLHDIE